eukprot:jgi/Botrbrau1/16057/Bobra.7_2s0031.1
MESQVGCSTSPCNSHLSTFSSLKARSCIQRATLKSKEVLRRNRISRTWKREERGHADRPALCCASSNHEQPTLGLCTRCDAQLPLTKRQEADSGEDDGYSRLADPACADHPCSDNHYGHQTGWDGSSRDEEEELPHDVMVALAAGAPLAAFNWEVLKPTNVLKTAQKLRDRVYYGDVLPPIGAQHISYARLLQLLVRAAEL